MMGGPGEIVSSAYRQTLNGHGLWIALVNPMLEYELQVGHALVSRAGDAGCTESVLNGTEYSLIPDPTKAVG